jgi:succinate dehydrogenase / fumarate reductase, cytochrome b subunit
MATHNTSSPAAGSNRPLSPHLQIYRWHLSMVLSVLHRATGIALSGGLVLFAWWVLALASGPEAYASLRGFLASPLGLFMLLGWTWSLFFHFANGIRHLIWDTGAALDLPAVKTGGMLVVAASILLTAVAWAAVFAL